MTKEKIAEIAENYITIDQEQYKRIIEKQAEDQESREKLLVIIKELQEELKQMKEKFLPKKNSKRICKGCNRDISHKHSNAKFHSPQCKDNYWNSLNPRGYGLREPDYDDDSSWDAHKDY
jgi:predicted RNA-binding Zn-ribbon protein involved in translation (DUF1610 family)